MMFTPEWFRSCREERTAHVGGRHWRMHKTDGDRWPSDPHAIDDNGDKLDLGTGDIYSSINGKYVGKLTHKELVAVFFDLGLAEKRKMTKPDFRVLIKKLDIQ